MVHFQQWSAYNQTELNYFVDAAKEHKISGYITMFMMELTSLHQKFGGNCNNPSFVMVF